jgi:hypothetical protein
VSNFGGPNRADPENGAIDQTGRELGPELHGSSGLAANNGSDMGLTDTDNPTADTMTTVHVHLVLQTIKLLNDQKFAAKNRGLRYWRRSRRVNGVCSTNWPMVLRLVP